MRAFCACYLDSARLIRTLEYVHQGVQGRCCPPLCSWVRRTVAHTKQKISPADVLLYPGNLEHTVSSSSQTGTWIVAVLVDTGLR